MSLCSAFWCVHRIFTEFYSIQGFFGCIYLNVYKVVLECISVHWIAQRTGDAEDR